MAERSVIKQMLRFLASCFVHGFQLRKQRHGSSLQTIIYTEVFIPIRWIGLSALLYTDRAERSKSFGEKLSEEEKQQRMQGAVPRERCLEREDPGARPLSTGGGKNGGENRQWSCTPSVLMYARVDSIIYVTKVEGGYVNVRTAVLGSGDLSVV